MIYRDHQLFFEICIYSSKGILLPGTIQNFLYGDCKHPYLFDNVNPFDIVKEWSKYIVITINDIVYNVKICTNLPLYHATESNLIYWSIQYIKQQPKTVSECLFRLKEFLIWLPYNDRLINDVIACFQCIRRLENSLTVPLGSVIEKYSKQFRPLQITCLLSGCISWYMMNQPLNLDSFCQLTIDESMFKSLDKKQWSSQMEYVKGNTYKKVCRHFIKCNVAFCSRITKNFPNILHFIFQWMFGVYDY